MSELQTLVEHVEKEYIERMIDALYGDRIDAATAKKSARDFLTYTPFVSVQDLQQKLEAFETIYPQFGKLSLAVHSYTDNKQRHEKVQQMHALIKDNKIDDALELVYNR